MSNHEKIDWERLGRIHNEEGINLKKIEKTCFNPSPEQIEVMNKAKKKLGEEKL